MAYPLVNSHPPIKLSTYAHFLSGLASRRADPLRRAFHGIQKWLKREKSGWNGAGERNRTPDRLITNQLLDLLSYASLIQTCETGI